MKILIDNGHGENTPGKRSPDGSLREYAYAREIANRIAHELSARGYDAERIVRETVDVPLSERARRVNEVCGRYGTANVVLVSIHCNAAGNGAEWMNARGTPIYHTFENADDFIAFSQAACAYVIKTVQEGWKEKDEVDWTVFNLKSNNDEKVD